MCVMPSISLILLDSVCKLDTSHGAMHSTKIAVQSSRWLYNFGNIPLLSCMRFFASALFYAIPARIIAIFKHSPPPNAYDALDEPSPMSLIGGQWLLSQAPLIDSYADSMSWLLSLSSSFHALEKEEKKPSPSASTMGALASFCNYSNVTMHDIQIYLQKKSSKKDAKSLAEHSRHQRLSIFLIIYNCK